MPKWVSKEKTGIFGNKYIETKQKRTDWELMKDTFNTTRKILGGGSSAPEPVYEEPSEVHYHEVHYHEAPQPVEATDEELHVNLTLQYPRAKMILVCYIQSRQLEWGHFIVMAAELYRLLTRQVGIDQIYHRLGQKLFFPAERLEETSRMLIDIAAGRLNDMYSDAEVREYQEGLGTEILKWQQEQAASVAPQPETRPASPAPTQRKIPGPIKLLFGGIILLGLCLVLSELFGGNSVQRVSQTTATAVQTTRQALTTPTPVVDPAFQGAFQCNQKMEQFRDYVRNFNELSFRDKSMAAAAWHEALGQVDQVVSWQKKCQTDVAGWKPPYRVDVNTNEKLLMLTFAQPASTTSPSSSVVVYLSPADKYPRLTRPTVIGAKRPR